MMKHMLLPLICALLTTGSYAKDAMPSDTDDVKALSQKAQEFLKPKALYSYLYDDFKFTSDLGNLYQHYSGYTNSNSVGADNLRLGNDLYWAFNLYTLTTNTDTASRLLTTVTTTNSNVQNNGLFLSLKKEVYPLLYVHLFGSVGRARYHATTTMDADTATPQSGFDNYYGYDNVLGIKTSFDKVFGSFLLQGHVSYFHSSINQPTNYTNYPGFKTTTPQLVTTMDTFIEHARLYYIVNERFAPFISGSLLQNADRSFSRPLIPASFVPIAPLPILLIGNSGFSYGAGVELHWKNFRMTPSFVHAERESHFQDNAGVVTFEITGLG